jgi:hypothetical protein
MARVSDNVLLDHRPTPPVRAASIAIWSRVKDAAKPGANGKKFKIVPERLLYSLRWKHNAGPPDYEMVLVQDGPVGWVNTANLTLLGELRRRAPHAIDWTSMADVVPVLDAFEAAREIEPNGVVSSSISQR